MEHDSTPGRLLMPPGDLRLRFVVPPHLPGSLAGHAAIRLRSVATGAGVEVIWLEAPLDAGFSLICRRQADEGLGWLMSDPAVLPDPLHAIELGQFARQSLGGDG